MKFSSLFVLPLALATPMNISFPEKTPVNISFPEKTPVNISFLEKTPVNIFFLEKTPVNISLPETTLTNNSLETRIQMTDRYMFSTTLPEFLEFRDWKIPAVLDWSFKGCSLKLPKKPFRFPFWPACVRLEFGYNNCNHQKRFTEAMRKRIDRVYKKDLVFLCNSDKRVKAKRACRAVANIYFIVGRITNWRRHKPTGDQDGLSVRAHGDSMEEYKMMYNMAVDEFKQAAELDHADGLLSFDNSELEDVFPVL